MTEYIATIDICVKTDTEDEANELIHELASYIIDQESVSMIQGTDVREINNEKHNGQS